MAKKSQEKKKKNKINNIVFILVCLVIVGSFSSLIVSQAASYNSLRAEHDRIEAELARARATYNSLRYQIAHFDSDAYIERLARDRLGWARPNEIIFRQRVD